MTTPLRYDQTLPNGQKLCFGMKGATWGGTVEAVMAAMKQPDNNNIMNTNKISAVLTQKQIDDVFAAYDTIETTLAFLATAPTDERRRMAVVASGRWPFIQKAYTDAQQHPEVLAGTFDLAEFGKDVDLLNAYATILARNAAHNTKLKDTGQIIGGDCYPQALDVYNYFQSANRNGQYDSQVKELGTFFAGQGKKAAPTPPSAAKASPAP